MNAQRRPRQSVASKRIYASQPQLPGIFRAVGAEAEESVRALEKQLENARVETAHSAESPRSRNVLQLVQRNADDNPAA